MVLGLAGRGPGLARLPGLGEARPRRRLKTVTVLVEIGRALLALDGVDWALKLLCFGINGVQIAGNRVQVLPPRRLGFSSERAASRLLTAEHTRVALLL